jgi:hypothetical protein
MVLSVTFVLYLSIIIIYRFLKGALRFQKIVFGCHVKAEEGGKEEERAQEKHKAK